MPGAGPQSGSAARRANKVIKAGRAKTKRR
jgi:hypothetical protein